MAILVRAQTPLKQLIQLYHMLAIFISHSTIATHKGQSPLASNNWQLLALHCEAVHNSGWLLTTCLLQVHMPLMGDHIKLLALG